MTERPQPQPGILEIAPYVAGKSGAPGATAPIKLSSNESPLGCSPKAVEAFKAMADRLADYPDSSAAKLRTAVGETYGLDPSRLVVGAGSDELLHLIAQAYLGHGTEAVMSQYGFLVYPIVTRAAGAELVVAPENDYRTDVDAILGAVTEKTRVVFLANPNNPTGTHIGPAELARLHAGLRPDILLVLDAAYAEYIDDENYEPGIDLVDRSENVVMTRTFSKIGLANLRVGWLYGPPHVVDVLNRIRGPFNVNGAALAAAEAAVRDTGFTARLREHNSKWRDWLTAELSGNAMRVLPSQCNFILVFFPDEEGRTAADANALLTKNNLIVREMGAYGMPDALRISIGTEEAMRKVAEVLKGLGQ
ncbi:histidinol-phosphate transaminase [Cucumibacter marinus]|uniref:histidinol-phosphate transaminase n=1 Tax=Cucumibacter marinus TaxID=1121252 RepID=UPI000403D538|nr:histidinol-phosphate transaminase [Cucumibacter marinus]